MLIAARRFFTIVPLSVPRPLHRAYLFGVTSGFLGLLVHGLVFIPLFTYLGLDTLAAINVASVAIYLISLWMLTRHGAVYLAYALGIGEVAAHSALAVLYIGAASGFQYYILAAMSLGSFLPSRSRLLNAILVGLMVLVFLSLEFIGRVHPAWAEVDEGVVQVMFAFNGLVSLCMVGGFTLYYRRLAIRAEDGLREEHKLSESLLLNILPQPIAAQLKSGQANIADTSPHATVLFSDIVGFTELSANTPAEDLVAFLNVIFCAFDDLTVEHGLEKIKTIGDAYMVAAGIPVEREDHAQSVARMALAMREVVRGISEQGEGELSVRIGIHTGPVVAGVIGRVKFAYDLWGDTVNTAARMESHGVPGRIQVTRDTWQLLKDEFEFEPRGTITVKGKGELETWFLEGEKESRTD